MKLNVVPARTGVVWVKLGMQTFFKQPMAMSGLFFMFMALLSIVGLVPYIGTVLACALLPAFNLGLMAATQEASLGKFPTPSILISAFRAGQQRSKAMMVLGLLYTVGFLCVVGLSALLDGGEFVKFVLTGRALTEELLLKSDFQRALWAALLLYMPLSWMFLHAPALVHWYGVPPLKSLFFSFVACYKNWTALAVFTLAWAGVLMGIAMALSLVAVLLGNPKFAAVAIFPAVMLVTVVFFTSLYFTFRDIFLPDTPDIAPESTV